MRCFHKMVLAIALLSLPRSPGAAEVQPDGVSVTTSAALPAGASKKSGQRRIFKAEWPSISKHRTPQWFQDAKFGIYTHWGPPVVATQHRTTEWYGWGMYLNDRRHWTNHRRADQRKGLPRADQLHREKWGDPNEFGYKDFIMLFQPTAFDAEQWADVFARSGAKFAGPVGVHHDNFLMWDSQLTRWNVKRTTGIDVTGELEKAIRKRGMRFVMTFHHAFSWWFFTPSYNYDGGRPGNEDLYGRPHTFSEDHDSFDEYPDEEYEETWLRKLEEAFDKYNPDLLWFDMGLELLSERIRKKAFSRLLNKAGERDQDIGFSYKVKFHPAIPPKAGILDYEKGRSTVIRELPWLTDTTLGGWYYNGRPSRSADATIEILVDIVSKNGCMLLNVSPKPDGSLPEDQVETLLGVGEWLKINGEAIYNTRPWVVSAEGNTQLAKDSHFNENWEAIYTEKDMRFTRSKDGNTLYVTVLGRPKDNQVKVTKLGHIYPYLQREITAAALLGCDEPIRWNRGDRGLDLSFPDDAPGQHAWSYRLTLGDPQAPDRDN